MSTETIIKKKGPPISIIHKETIGGEDYIGGGGNSNIGGEDFIEGAGEGITRDIKSL